MAKETNEMMEPTESKDLSTATEPADGGSPGVDNAIDAAVVEPEAGAPTSQTAQTDDAPLASADTGRVSGEESEQPSLEELVERKVAESISTIFPEGAETPRIANPREQLDASDYLRLGYGTRSPHV